LLTYEQFIPKQKYFLHLPNFNSMSYSFSTPSVSLEACLLVGAAAVPKANELGIKIAPTPEDNAGKTKYYIRKDNAPLTARNISEKKAVTAVGFSGYPQDEAVAKAALSAL
jgi:uncharacterized protein GlcG (DUF336 family)